MEIKKKRYISLPKPYSYPFSFYPRARFFWRKMQNTRLMSIQEFEKQKLAWNEDCGRSLPKLSVMHNMPGNKENNSERVNMLMQAMFQIAEPRNAYSEDGT